MPLRKRSPSPNNDDDDDHDCVECSGQARRKERREQRLVVVLATTVAGFLVGLLTHPCTQQALYPSRSRVPPSSQLRPNGSVKPNHNPIAGKPTPHNRQEEQPAVASPLPPLPPWAKPACTLPKFDPNETMTLTCAPRVLIAGAMKCGTNAIADLYALHPRLAFKLCEGDCDVPGIDELYQGSVNSDTMSPFLWESPPWYLNFDDRYVDYFKRFPVTDGVHNITIDKSPAFMNHPGLPQAVSHLMPDTRLVFAVCDPAERLVSEYHHHHQPALLQGFNDFFHAQNVTPPTDIEHFASIMALSHAECQEGNALNCESLRDHFLDNGLYVRHLKRWWEYVDQKDTLVIDMNDRPESIAKRLLDFAGLPHDEYPWDRLPTEKVYHPQYGASATSRRERAWDENPMAMRIFAEQYSPTNHELASALQQDFPLHWKSTL